MYSFQVNDKVKEIETAIESYKTNSSQRFNQYNSATKDDMGKLIRQLQSATFQIKDAVDLLVKYDKTFQETFDEESNDQ